MSKTGRQAWFKHPRQEKLAGRWRWGALNERKEKNSNITSTQAIQKITNNENKNGIEL